MWRSVREYGVWGALSIRGRSTRRRPISHYHDSESITLGAEEGVSSARARGRGASDEDNDRAPGSYKYKYNTNLARPSLPQRIIPVFPPLAITSVTRFDRRLGCRIR